MNARQQELRGRLDAIRERIARACQRAGRDPTGVTLIAVSKTFPPEDVLAAFEAGQRDFGENRIQEALAKASALRGCGVVPRWHMVGHLQTNKARAAAANFASIHGVDSERLLDAIARHASSAQPAHIFIEVNITGESSKSGVAPDAAAALVARARDTGGVILHGLMTIGPREGGAEAARPVFRQLRELAAATGLHELSMGMSGDFETAIEEGATHIRVGQAIFGGRV